MSKEKFFRNFGAVYFVLQYLIVHVALFGWVFEPERLVFRAVTTINYGEIFRALWNYRNVFLAGVTFQSVVVLLLVAVPYTMVLIWALRYVLIYLFVLYQVIWYIRIRLKQWKHERGITLDNVVVVKIGAPSAGKSSSGLYEAVVMAKKMWAELRYKYYKLQREKRKSTAHGDPNSQGVAPPAPADFDEIEHSYNYFAKSNCVPCLLSNIPVMVDGKYTTFVSREHCEQRERLPAHCVLFLDEVGAMISVDTAKQRQSGDGDALSVSDFFRLCRHFGNWRIICTEQDSENIYIDVRRVVSKNEYMLSQRWVLKPYLFLALFYPLRRLAIWRVSWRGKYTRVGRWCIAGVMFLETLCRAIGFRKYRYLTENNTERGSGMQTGKRVFYLPSMLNFRYDERTFRNFYRAKDKEITPHIFDNLVLDDVAPFGRMFLRAKRGE